MYYDLGHLEFSVTPIAFASELFASHGEKLKHLGHSANASNTSLLKALLLNLKTPHIGNILEQNINVKCVCNV